LTQKLQPHFTAGQGDHVTRQEIIKGPKGATMGILRKAIVAGGMFVALPMPPQSGPVQSVEQTVGPGTFAYMAAASDTFADVSSFCQRRPTACNVAQYIAVTAQAKAKYSAKIVYEWANTRDAAQTPAPGLPIQAADANAIPLPIEKPANFLARKPPHKKS
jgi:hypothetical protein